MRTFVFALVLALVNALHAAPEDFDLKIAQDRHAEAVAAAEAAYRAALREAAQALVGDLERLLDKAVAGQNPERAAAIQRVLAEAKMQLAALAPPAVEEIPVGGYPADFRRIKMEIPGRWLRLEQGAQVYGDSADRYPAPAPAGLKGAIFYAQAKDEPTKFSVTEPARVFVIAHLPDQAPNSNRYLQANGWKVFPHPDPVYLRSIQVKAQVWYRDLAAGERVEFPGSVLVVSRR